MSFQGDLAAADAFSLLEFGALLSLNLAVFNSLPLPGLDGWQVRGKRGKR